MLGKLSQWPLVHFWYHIVYSFAVDNWLSVSMCRASNLFSITQLNVYCVWCFCRRKSPALFSADQLAVMESWYSANKHWPYPLAADLEMMASVAGLDVCQVKKWFDNERTRRGNTYDIAARMLYRRMMKSQSAPAAAAATADQAGASGASTPSPATQ